MGEIVAVEGDGFTVVCADGRFQVARVQADGPKIAASEFAAVAKLSPGMRFS
jgi:methionyl-tRNA formyltransferase